MDRLRLLKILYIADRQSLQETGSPILGGRAVAMNHGPLHSDVYDMIKGTHPMEREWAKFIENEGTTVVLRDDPGRLDLSPYEIDKLNAITDWAKQFDTWELSEYTHGFQEWVDSFRKDTSTTIPPEKLLCALGFNQDDIGDILSDAESHRRLINLAG
ncbi:MAG: Panacea domain-containing protein [Planctomycetaceae bacterium]